MRYCNKYKAYTKVNLFLTKSSIRILSFNRPKWKRLQTILSTKNALTRSFGNLSNSKINYKSWDKIQSHYREGLQIKNAIYKLFDNSFSTRYYKKNLFLRNRFSLKGIILNSVIKPMFRLDILLYKLNFFKSPYQAKQSIQRGNVLINNVSVLSAVFIKKGDLISLKQKENNSFDKFSKTFETDLLFSFTETDYYSGTIVILKDYYQLTNEDFSLLFTESINFKKFFDYIKTK